MATGAAIPSPHILDAPAPRVRFPLSSRGEYTQDYTDVNGRNCAQRELVLSLGEWATHFFTSDVTPQGDVEVAQWVSFWTDDASRNFSDPGFAWDAWMSHAMTFYSPELSPFVLKWQSTKTPFLGE